MSMVITAANFESEVLKSDKPVLVDFWAPWCGPCRMQGPIVDDIAKTHPEYKVCKVNTDEEQSLAAKFDIMSIPTLMVFKDGKQTALTMGVTPKDKLLAMLK